jgi:hypothetical protein
MAEVIERPPESTTTSEQETERGRPQRESVAIILQELGFYDRLPKIREDSRAYLRSSRERLLAERQRPKWTHELALAERERFRRGSRLASLIEPDKFSVATLEPQGVPYGGSIELPAQNPIQPGLINVVGSGTGWDLNAALGTGFMFPFGFIAGLAGIDALPNQRQFLAVWEFPFTSPADGSYRATAGLLAWGEYTLISDDGPFDSHEVDARVDALLTTTSGPVSSTELFSRGDDNINEKDSFANAASVELVTQGKAGQQIKFHAGILLTVEARGDDTFAQLDATQGIGGLMSGGLTVDQIA